MHMSRLFDGFSAPPVEFQHSFSPHLRHLRS